MVDHTTRKVMSARLRAKPAHDTKDVEYLIRNVSTKPKTCIMDKGFDSEKNP